MYEGDSTASLTNVTFAANSADSYGGGMDNHNNSSPTLPNVTFYSNAANEGGGGMTNVANSNPTLTNVTFSNNITISAGSGLCNNTSNPSLTNVILWDDISRGQTEIHSYNSAPLISYSVVRGGYHGTGNQSTDPLLGLLQDNGGFTRTLALGVGSPAIDAGTGAGCSSPDQRGAPRPFGTHCDMGAFEFIQYRISGNAGTGGVTLYFADGLAITDALGNYSLGVPYNWSGIVTVYKEGYRFTPESRSYSNVLSDQAGRNYTATQLFTISGNAGVAGAVLSYLDGVQETVTADAQGNYSFTVPAGWSGTVTPSKTGAAFTPSSSTYASIQGNLSAQDYSAYVSVINTNDGGSGSLRQAISDALPGTVIHFDPQLAGQTIPLSSQVTLTKNLTLDGSGLSPRVEISGRKSSRIFLINRNLTITLRSMILKDGKTTGTSYSSYGGAVYAESDTQLTIEKVAFVGNSAPQAGALYAAGFSKIVITESEFLSNTAEWLGGAIYLPTPLNLTATKTRFAGNSASSGGAVYLDACSGAGVFEENVFENNTSTSGGGAIASYNSPGVGLQIRRNLFLNNSTGSGGGAISISRFSSTIVILENNTFYGNQSANVGGAVSTGAGTDLKNNTFPITRPRMVDRA